MFADKPRTGTALCSEHCKRWKKERSKKANGNSWKQKCQTTSESIFFSIIFAHCTLLKYGKKATNKNKKNHSKKRYLSSSKRYFPFFPFLPVVIVSHIQKYFFFPGWVTVCILNFNSTSLCKYSQITTTHGQKANAITKFTNTNERTPETKMEKNHRKREKNKMIRVNIFCCSKHRHAVFCSAIDYFHFYACLRSSQQHQMYNLHFALAPKKKRNEIQVDIKERKRERNM